ncbi:MAG: FG-GAP-like repeat-containing protein [Candidatus Kerfeldbacteria bacterium]
MPRYIRVDTEVQRSVKIAHAISVGIYLVAAIGLASILGGLVLQFAFQGGVSVQSVAADSTNSANLIWSAPGDDENVGTAASYTVRYSTSPLDNNSWASAVTAQNPPTPFPASTVQTMTVAGLNPGTTYYFGIKSKDDAGNESALSNVASKKTETKACVPDWSCTLWSICKDGSQIRSCIDVAETACNSDYNRPIESQTCSAQNPAWEACSERWSCSEWTPCVSGLRMRACQDVNRCGTTTNRPAVSYDCSAGGPPPENPLPAYLVTTQAKGGKPQVKVYSATAGSKSIASFNAYKASYRNGLFISGGDIERKGGSNVVVGSGIGSIPEVQLYTLKGKLVTRYFPFTKKMKTGAAVAVADVSGDGFNDIVIAPAGNYPGFVRVSRYNPTSKKFTRFAEFSAQSSKYRGGVNIAAADLDQNGFAEIIVAPASKGRQSTVEVYEYDKKTKKVVKRTSFSAYAKSFNGGMKVGNADIDGDGIKEILVSPAPGATDVRVYSYSNRKARLMGKFFAGSTQFRGGVDVAGSDVNFDGKDEVLTAMYSNGLPGVRVFSWNATTKKFSSTKSPYPTYVFSTTFLKGIRIVAM